MQTSVPTEELIVRSSPIDDGDSRRITRRTFVGSVAAAVGTAALASPALGAPAPAAPPGQSLDRAAGVVTVDGVTKVLALIGTSWVLVDADGTVRPTHGLSGATVIDVTTGPGGLVVAVGSLPVGEDTAAVVWESRDGLAWREANRLGGLHAEFTAVGADSTSFIVLGALLTPERAPGRRIAVRRTDRGWVTVPVRGLEWTDESPATAVAGGAGGWVTAAVAVTGTLLSTSRDGYTWTPAAAEPRLVDAAVKALTFVGDRVRWVGNGMSGTAPLAGTLGAGRTTVAVPTEAHAVGVVPASSPVRSVWLADGRLVTSNV